MHAFRVDRSKPMGESSMVVDEITSQRDGRASDGKPSRKCWVACVMIAFGLASSTGCTAWTGAQQSWQYNRYWNDGMMSYRQKCMATKAWHSRKHCYINQKNLKDFSRGFKAGYMDVAAGRDGCTPAFPPREYWGWKYQSCEGQARVAAWFSGYPQGAMAAEKEGVGNWTQIQTSRSIQSEYVQHGRMPTEFNGIYPVPSFDQNFQTAVQASELPSGEVVETTIIEERSERQVPTASLRIP
jgi:hypothetical protein